MERLDLTNHRFGRLVSLSSIQKRLKSGRRVVYWNCICDCGDTCTVITDSLRSGKTKSCGCLKKDNLRKRSLTHGERVGRKYSTEYKAWQRAKSRCYNANDKKFPRYGGRGIKMCERWISNFAVFLEDMGRKPSPQHSIDRKDNDGNYEPNNCRWATPKEQANNTSQNVIVTVDGEKFTLKQFADNNDVNYKRLHELVRKKRLSPSQAIKRLTS